MLGRRVLVKLRHSRLFSWKIRFTSSSTAGSGSLESSTHDSLYLNPFREGENTFAIAHLKTRVEYQNTLFDPTPFQSPTKWGTFKPIVQKLKEESNNPENPLLSTSPVNFISSVIAEKGTFSDEELFAVLYALQLYKFRPFPKSDSVYKDLWEALDQECVTRFHGWDLNTLLKVDDLLYNLNSVSLSFFHWKVVKKLFRKCGKLSKEQFIRFMFCLNVGRRIPKDMITYELEHNLIRIVEHLTPEEIAITSMAFFKTESKVREDRIMKMLLERVMPAAGSLNGYFISAVAKLTRFCGKSGIAMTIYDFQNAFFQELHRLNLTESIHLALVGTNTAVKHTPLLEKVRDKTEMDLPQARLKELERILLALTMFNVECKSLCLKIIEQLREPSPTFAKECHEYGRCVPSILHYTTIQNIIPQDLINRVLDPEYLKTYYDKNRYKYQREMLCLDMTAEIECPDYKGHRFSVKDRHSVTKFNLQFLMPEKEKVSEYERGLRAVGRNVKDILGGEEFMLICHVLPQYHTAEIMYILDENNKPVKIPQSIRQLEQYETKWIPKDDPSLKNATFHLIMYCNKNICLFGQHEMLGQAKMQCRQLEKMGYKLNFMYALDWNTYYTDEGKRRDHVCNLIENSKTNYAGQVEAAKV